MDKKALVQKYPGVVGALCSLYNLGAGLLSHIRGRGNRVLAPRALLKGTKIHIHGNDNLVTVGDFSRLTGGSIHISGSHNRIVIGSFATLNGAVLHMEGDGNTITLGDRTKLMGAAELAALEGTSITVGSNCLFSSGVHVRTGDSHSLTDLSGHRINPSRDIRLGDHVWVGTGVTVLKGSVVGPDSMLGACALVCGAFPEGNQVLAGVPARVVKREVNWDIRRLPLESSTQ